MNEVLALPLKILLIALDLLISLLTFKWIKVIQTCFFASEELLSVPLNEDDPSHRVHPEFVAERATKPGNGATTMWELADIAFDQFSDSVCMRRREFLGWKVPKKVKEFSSKVDEFTFDEVSVTSMKFGAALRSHGGCVSADSKTTIDAVKIPCRIAIFENTCPEWMMACLGAFSQSIAVMTVYATLGIDAVIEAVCDNQVPVIVCNRSNVKYLVDQAQKMKCLKVIVYTNDLVSGEDEAKDDLPRSTRKLAIYSFDEFVNLGEVTSVSPPSPDTTAVVMYTSGSTGKPKGVVVSHRSIVSCIASAEHVIDFKANDKYLAYLPLAHIMEFMVEFTCLMFGVSLNYADPKSLSATGAYPIGALEQYSPTHMVAVPKIWDTLKKGILAKVAASSPVKQMLVHTAIQWRTFAMQYGLDTPLFNALVFKKFKKAVGGELIWALSGGGPLNARVQEFIQVVFGIPLVQGYGLTETCAGVAIGSDGRPNIAGNPLPSVEVKVVSTPDVCDKAGVPYLSTDRRDVNGDAVWGRGEIWVKGGNITSGYYMLPEQTKESFKEGGWFATGDIGQFLKDGSIRIVDRKKNLVKLKNGEYVALESMEMVYGNSVFVDAVNGGICCYADGEMDRPIALFQLSESAAMNWAKENKVDGGLADIQKSPEFQKALLGSFLAEHAQSDLSGIEKLVAVQPIVNSPWTPENGCLTAANKLQRRVVQETFSKELGEAKKKGIF